MYYIKVTVIYLIIYIIGKLVIGTYSCYVEYSIEMFIYSILLNCYLYWLELNDFSN